VDWHPWNEEALDRARKEDKPILLSVGYSACHWCHVMEHESFEDPKIAAIMNDHFVNIKVDREERPDLDEIYMNAVTAMTGSGGWPMTVFLTPDLKPFYGGTYFPPDDRYGRPGFPRVLLAVAQFYKERRAEAEEQGNRLQERLAEFARFAPDAEAESLNEDLLESAFRAISETFDPVHGGFGRQPKFPGSMALSFCLREHRRTGRQTALDIVTLSLRKMANGGLYDQLGGGFHRYSVDDKWLIPHFEKMLYDNALLMRTYLEAYQCTKDPLFRRVVEETADYVLREMFRPGGGFYATQDADSEGEEGRYFVWTRAEVLHLLGEEKGRLFCRYYGVEEDGNFEHGRSVLHVDVPLETLAAHLQVDPAYFREALAEGRRALFAAREERVKPHRDEKILTDWNGLMVGSMAQTCRVLGNPAYLAAAEDTMRFILDTLYEDDRLLHVYKDGVAKLSGYLDDYAFVVSALLDLYEATFDVTWFEKAVDLNNTMIERFWDDKDGAFFFTGADHEHLIVRSRNPYDNAIPSGNAVAVHNLIRLAALTDWHACREMAERTLGVFADFMKNAPGGFGHLLCGLSWYLGSSKEIAIIGSPDDEATRALLAAVNERLLPHKVTALYDPASGDWRPPDLIPLLANRQQIDGRPTAYVCQGFVCHRPVTTVDDLIPLLE
jgi:uncharacterized protein YyaL (SSP411 family)